MFRDTLLPASETFVTGQAEALRRWTPIYGGCRRVPGGLELPEQRVLLVNRGGLAGRAAEVVFKLTGLAPGFDAALRRAGIGLVHAHFGIDGLLALPVAGRLGVPLLVTYHGYDATVTGEQGDVSFYPHRKYLRHRDRVARGADRVLAVSGFIRDTLLSQGFPPEKVFVHHVGIDTARFSPGPEEAREPVVLFVGRLVPNKGCGYLIEAMRTVQAERPEVELVVVGDGTERAALEAAAAGLPGRWRFLGRQSHDAVRDWMRRASVFCVPSVRVPSGASEGFGLVFCEAQASGLPVVSFRTGGIPEAVEHGVTGFLSEPGDAAGLAGHLSRLLRDRDLWSRFSQAGVERVRRLFDLQRQTASLEDHYDAVLEAAG